MFSVTEHADSEEHVKFVFKNDLWLRLHDTFRKVVVDVNDKFTRDGTILGRAPRAWVRAPALQENRAGLHSIIMKHFHSLGNFRFQQTISIKFDFFYF